MWTPSKLESKSRVLNFMVVHSIKTKIRTGVLLSFLWDDKFILERKPKVNKSIEALELEKTELDSQILALKNALERMHSSVFKEVY